MTNKFMNAVKSTPVMGQTFNGANTFTTTGDPVLDFFNSAGNRGVDLSKEFDRAYASDPKLAFRVALWMRDVRSGAGERSSFRKLLSHFETKYPDALVKMLPVVPEFGRWDDGLYFTNPIIRDKYFDMIKTVLYKGKKAKDLLDRLNFMTEEECQDILKEYQTT